MANAERAINSPERIVRLPINIITAPKVLFKFPLASSLIATDIIPIAAESINMLFEAVINFFGFGKADSAAIIPPNNMDIAPITAAAISTFVESNSDKIAIIRPIPFMADPSVFIIKLKANI